MDTKLKNKNISFNVIAFIMAIGITMIPVIYIFFDELIFSKYISEILVNIFFISVFLLSSVIFYKVKKLNTFKFKDNIITLCYSNIYIEAKSIFIIIILFLLQYIYSGLNYEWHSEQVLIFSSIIICIILIYGVICDCYKLSKITEKEELEKYIKDKSILYYFYIRLKNILNKIIAIFVKSLESNNISSKRLVTEVVVFSIYIFSSIIIVWTYVYRKMVIGLISYADMKILPLFIVNVIIVGLIAIYVFILESDISTIKTLTQNILNGQIDNEKNIKKIIINKDIADDIKNIENGLNKAVEEAVKSERMKGELITNVSHDLKTPLTSIINYIDFLDKENISEDEKKKYISILKERSNRLKILIEDLFEVSKASSGNVELNMENIDLIALIRQTLGEFEEKIEKSTLSFIKEIPDRVIIYADGKKTFRVFQNIISNILKYSMDNSRVYISVNEEEELISIVFRNISKYQINMNEEEILERFKRGDSSRTTEGSGLGLAIAKSLIELQGGKFELVIDGDLFKVKIMIRKENEINSIN